MQNVMGRLRGKDTAGLARGCGSGLRGSKRAMCGPEFGITGHAVAALWWLGRVVQLLTLAQCLPALCQPLSLLLLVLLFL